MRSYLTGLSIISLISLIGCGDRQPPEYIYITPDVPADLRQPVEVPNRKVSGLNDVAVVLTDHVEALESANDKIVTTDCILTAAETRQDPECGAEMP